MEFEDRLAALASKVKQQQAAIQTEEATKTALIMPFIQSVLGYDVFDPAEVVPEFTADVGTKKGEKVDYAICMNGQVQILMECKKVGDALSIKHASQLYRYFSVTSARIAILTNGQIYQFFTDLEAPNKMDEKPFLVLDLLDIDDYAAPEIKKLTKPAFDVDSVISAAGELKYVSQLKRAIAALFSNPEDDFSRLLISRVYEGTITQKVREQFAALISKAMRQFLNEQANDRLKSAISGVSAIPEPQPTVEASQVDSESEAADDSAKDKVVTTEEELDGFNIVRAIARSEIDVKRVHPRDTQSYFGILVDDNNRKPVCRLHFNRQQKYIGLFDAEKNETRHPIESVDDIYSFSDQIRETVRIYL